jgi:hypothetical protein
MGGLGGDNGHLNHLYEDYNLTFGAIKQILLDLIENKIPLYEKVDGQNLSLTYNPKTHLPLAARNKSDVKAGGMSLIKIAERYHEKPGVKAAFSDAMKAFNNAVRTMTYYERFQVFDPALGGIPFVNAEVMSTKNPNIIKYDGNYLVMHCLNRFPKSGKAFSCDDSFDDIVSTFGEIKVDVDGDDWKICGPRFIDLSESMNKSGMRIAADKIHHLMQEWNLDDTHTVRDFLIKFIFTTHAPTLSVPIDSRLALESRLLDERGSKTTPSIVKSLLEHQKIAVTSLAKNRVALVREALVPLEMIINDFGLALLEYSHSSFVHNGKGQVLDLRSRVDNAIETLKKSGDLALRAKVDLNWTKLGRNTNTITSTVEGIVFKLSGQSYKITGAFAPMNQILGWVNPAFTASRGRATSSPLSIFMG